MTNLAKDIIEGLFYQQLALLKRVIIDSGLHYSSSRCLRQEIDRDRALPLP